MTEHVTSSSQQPVRVGRYELLLRLGYGPLGEMWAAAVTEGAEQGRLVAARRVRFGDGEARGQASRAAEIARTLRHPKVAAVLDVIEQKNELVIVSEYVDGESLAVLLRQATSSRAPVPPGVAVAIARDATDALVATREHFAKHAKAPPAHGGLVPHGLVVAAFGDTMLIEPGVLAALGDAALHGSALCYRSLEELGDPRRRDERSDVFAVGVLLWEMLANRGLFRSKASADAEARAELRQKILSEPIPPLDDQRRAGAPLPQALGLLVSRALMRDPGRRFATLNALREALDALPRDLLAPPEQVTATLDRLVRQSLEARRDALSQFEDRISMSPQSVRITARPAPPEVPETLVIPDAGAPLSQGAFGTSEAPTLRRPKPAPPPPRPAEQLEPASKPVGQLELSPKPVEPVDLSWEPVGQAAPASRPGGQAAPASRPGGQAAPESKPAGQAAPVSRPGGPIGPASEPTQPIVGSDSKPTQSIAEDSKFVASSPARAEPVAAVDELLEIDVEPEKIAEARLPEPASTGLGVTEEARLREPTSTGVSVIEDARTPMQARSNARRFAPLVLIAVGVSVLVAGLLALRRPSEPASTAATARTETAPVPSVQTGRRETAPVATEPAAPSRSAAPTASESAAPAASESAAPARSAKPPPDEGKRREPEREVKPKEPAGFRPKGI